MNRLFRLPVFAAVTLSMSRQLPAQVIASCQGRLNITVDNTTAHSYDIKLDGTLIGRVGPGQHIHVGTHHGILRLEGVPVSTGPSYSQRMEMHSDFVWRLRPAPVGMPLKPVPMAMQVQAQRDEASASHTIYTQVLDAGGIKIKAPAVVSPRALRQAKTVLDRMLANAPHVRGRLARWGVEIVIFGAKQKITDLPETVQLRGKPDVDGGLYDDIQGMTRMNKMFVAESNLLALPGDRFADESVLAHELGHLVMHVALEEADHGQVFAAWLAAEAKDLWKDRYATKNPAEYFAELTQSYFGLNDPADPNGPAALKAQDPDGFALVAAVFSDRPLPKIDLAAALASDDIDAEETQDKPQTLRDAVNRLDELMKLLSELLQNLKPPVDRPHLTGN